MSKIFTKQNKLDALNKILRSKKFQESDVSSTLLKYLFELALKEIIPKEKTIAFELYGKKDLDSSADSYVRSNVYKLRKRLLNYYENEGKKDELRLIIPKGSYHVEFIEKTKDDTKQLSKNKKALNFLVYSVFATIIVSAIFLVFYPENDENSVSLRESFFWSGFEDNLKPITLVISDIIMFNEVDPELNRDRSIFDPQIYTKADLQEFQNNHPDRRINDLEYSFVLMSNPANFFRLGQILYDIPNEIKFQWSSDITWEHISNSNIIFIGDPRSINILGTLLNETHIQVEAPYTISWTDELNDTTLSFTFKQYNGRDWENYAAVLKIPGPNKNIIVLIIGTTYSARIIMMEKLREFEFLQDLNNNFESKFETVPKYFELLYKVKGFPRSAHTLELIQMGELKEDQFHWNK